MLVTYHLLGIAALLLRAMLRRLRATSVVVRRLSMAVSLLSLAAPAAPLLVSLLQRASPRGRPRFSWFEPPAIAAAAATLSLFRKLQTAPKLGLAIAGLSSL